MNRDTVLIEADELLARLGANNLRIYDATILFFRTYCGGGIAATLHAVAHLIAGHENVSVYDGSLLEWMGEGLPLAESTR